MYLLPFNNNYSDHDFSLIKETLNEYYPSTSSKRLKPEMLSSFAGFIKKGEIIEREFTDAKAYKAKWGRLVALLKSELGKKVISFGDLAGSAFFGEVVLGEIKETDFSRTKSLYFYVSILGPFFSIHGVDRSVALLPDANSDGAVDTGHFEAMHVVTVSPVFEYEEAFKALEEKLRSFFPGYRFVPYDVGMSTRKNISYVDELQDPRTRDTVYEGIFGRVAVHDCLTRGDIRYGFDDWKRSLTRKELSLLDEISRNIASASEDVTIHKVWKLKEFKRMETFKISGNLMFTMDLFEVIDLTDGSSVIVVSKEGATSKVRYKIKDDVIKITSEYSLRVTDVSKDTLALNLILNFAHEDVSIKGEALEMKFVQMKKLG